MTNGTISSDESTSTSRILRTLGIGGWLIAAGLVSACAADVAESDEPTAEDQQALVVAGRDYGGAYGFVNGAATTNPATGAASCPAGYTATQVLGTSGVDYSMYICSRAHQQGVESIYDYGGMWGYVNAGLQVNPITGTAGCPVGYTDQHILGTTNVDWHAHICYKAHVAGTTPAFGFGGVWGYINGGQLAANPATGAASCPSGYTTTQILGTNNVDWPVYTCTALPADTSLDFGGAYGYVNAALVTNPATGSASCPSGYTTTQIYGTSGIDWQAYLCTRPHQPGAETLLDFGGMHGFVDGQPTRNWITGGPSCPAGYSDKQILGTNDVDYALHVCYKPHVAGTSYQYPFAGAWGAVNGVSAPNPATGAPTCPGGYRSEQVLGLVNKDYWMYVCSPVTISCGPSTMPCGSLAETYAPRVWLHADEDYRPSSTSDFLPNVHEEVVSGAHYYVTNQSLGCDSCTEPAFLVGRSPAQSPVPVYAEIVDRKQGGQPTNVTDVIYWMFYPYNNGKRVCLGGYFNNYCPFYCPGSNSCCVPRLNGCIGAYSTFGNHVGDWEHVTIRFIDGQPTQVALSQHDGGQIFNYGDPALVLQDGHPVVYAANGSHGLYPDAARHTYKTLPNGDTLNDDTSAGILWDTRVQVVTFSPLVVPQSGSLAWLNYSGRWGNPKSGCTISEPATGECVLNDGPGSILPRKVSYDSELALIE